jgi:hypothetical protein
MSTRATRKATGLVGASRSMNVRREDPKKWSSETPACSTSSLGTCAASARSVVGPARGICDSERAARRPLTARSTSRTRKPPSRPSGASMPCALGWLVRSVARQGGRVDEAATGMNTDVSCKANYAATVKIIMPHMRGSANRRYGCQSIFSAYLALYLKRGPRSGLTERN